MAEEKKAAEAKPEVKPEEKKEETKSKAKDEAKDEAKEEKKEVEVPEKFKKLVEEIEKMSVLELSELVKVLEDKFGVSAAAPVAIAGTVSAGAEGDGAEEKSAYNVELVSAGDSKISVIKVVNEITGLGLKGAKDLVDAAPKAIKENVPKAEAEEMKKKLEEAGATVELK